MNEFNNLPDPPAPWEETFQTGKTRPPKNHQGLIAVLLVAVILLGGIASVLGIVNIRLLDKLERQERPEDASLAFFHSEETLGQDTLSPEDTQPEDPQPSLQLEPSPTGEANIPQAGGLSLQEIYASAIDSVVSISCSLEGRTSTGTGVVLTSSGYLVTNHHVVENAVAIYAQFTDDRVLPAELVGSDATTDLAVLRVDATDLTPARFGDSASLRVGDPVAAIGDALGVELRGTMTDGIVSAINRDITTGGRTMTLIQTNAALNSGNSGGPLLNCYGQVVGINTMKIGDYMNAAGVEGLGFAIPSVTVQEIVDQLMTQGYVSGRPWLGISGQEVPFFYQLYKQLPQGLYITQVDSRSDAAAQGISPGDILLSLDGHRITDADSLTSLMYSYDVGDRVTVVIYRSGWQYELVLTVGEAN